MTWRTQTPRWTTTTTLVRPLLWLAAALRFLRARYPYSASRSVKRSIARQGAALETVVVRCACERV